MEVIARLVSSLWLRQLASPPSARLATGALPHARALPLRPRKALLHTAEIAAISKSPRHSGTARADTAVLAALPLRADKSQVSGLRGTSPTVRVFLTFPWSSPTPYSPQVPDCSPARLVIEQFAHPLFQPNPLGLVRRCLRCLSAVAAEPAPTLLLLNFLRGLMQPPEALRSDRTRRRVGLRLRA